MDSASSCGPHQAAQSRPEPIGAVAVPAGVICRLLSPSDRLLIFRTVPPPVLPTSAIIRQGNNHVHWHLAPLPPDVPFEQQQFAALDRSDCLDLSEAELADLAQRLRAALVPGR